VGFGLYVVAGPIAAHGVFALGKSCPHWLRALAAVALYLPSVIIGAALVILLCMCTPFVKWKQRTYRMGMRGNVVGVESNGSPEQCVAETPAAQDVATQHPVRGIP
jgi:hypothetical protein